MKEILDYQMERGYMPSDTIGFEPMRRIDLPLNETQSELCPVDVVSLS